MTNFISSPFDSQLSSSGGITYNLELVTPEQAKKWVEMNAENQRKLKEDVVLGYSRDMLSGRWRLTPDSPVSFDWNGRLINGQHRLSAVTVANIPIQFIVSRGWSPDVIECIDQGKSRTDVDRAHAKGFLHLNSTHFAIARACFYNPCEFSYAIKLTSQELLDLVIRHEEAISFSMKTSGYKGASAFSPILASVARAWYTQNHLRLQEFLEVLQSGHVIHSAGVDSAAVTLREFYYKNTPKKNGDRSYRTSMYRRANTALIAFLQKRPLTKHARESTSNFFPVAEFDAHWVKQRKTA